MTPFVLIIALGLVNWFVTTVVVEANVTQPIRSWFHTRWMHAQREWSLVMWEKLAYLVNCHMCAGVWVGLALAAFAPMVFGPGVIPFILVGLLIKAIGHLVLTVWHRIEIKPRDVSS